MTQLQQLTTPAVTVGEGTSTLGGPSAPSSDALVRLKARKADTEASLEHDQLRYTPNHPDIVKNRLLLKQIEKDIEAEEKRLASAPPPPMMAGVKDRKSTR